MVQGQAAGIRLARPDVGAEEAAAVAAVLESGQLTMGPLVAEFEAALAAACETREAVAVSSGTAALHLAVLALGIEHVGAEELEVRVLRERRAGERVAVEVVDRHDLVRVDELASERRRDEAGAAREEDALAAQ